MRRVLIPKPTTVWELHCTGPYAPGAPDADTARQRFDAALIELPDLDAASGADGWTVAWLSGVLVSGSILKCWLWCAPADRGGHLLRALGAHLEGAGFSVRLRSQPVAADPALSPRVVYLRSGALRFGLDSRSEPLFRQLVPVEAAREDVVFDRQFRFPVQRCPACGAEDHPAALVAGFPSPELLLAAELGEVVLAGCMVDPDAREDARCRHCGTDFVARS